MKFMTCSASIFASIFSSIFDGKWLPKRCHFIFMRWAFWRPFLDLFQTSIFWCILVAPWLTFGSLLTPIGSLLAPAGSLLAPFGSFLALFSSLLAHFWCPLAHFWCPLLHFCSPRDPFSHFCCILSSFLVFALNFPRKYHTKPEKCATEARKVCMKWVLNKLLFNLNLWLFSDVMLGWRPTGTQILEKINGKLRTLQW